MERLSLAEFLMLVETGELDRLAILDYIEKATRNFKPERLKILLDEIDIKIFDRKEELIASNADRVEKLLIQYLEEGKEVPYKEIKFDHKFKVENQYIIDTDKLLGGEITWQLYPLYELRKDVMARLTDPPKATTFHKPEASPAAPKFNFAHYLTEEGKNLLPTLLELYSKVRFKKEYAIMLYALKELGVLIDKTLSGQDQLHKALKATFPGVGTRQHLINYIQVYSAPNASVKAEIERHKQVIQEALKKGQ